MSVDVRPIIHLIQVMITAKKATWNVTPVSHRFGIYTPTTYAVMPCLFLSFGPAYDLGSPHHPLLPSLGIFFSTIFFPFDLVTVWDQPFAEIMFLSLNGSQLETNSKNVTFSDEGFSVAVNRARPEA